MKPSHKCKQLRGLHAVVRSREQLALITIVDGGWEKSLNQSQADIRKQGYKSL